MSGLAGLMRQEDVTKGKPPAALWRCPRCQRRFANRNQSHACGRSTLASHFAGKPKAVRAIFDKLLFLAKRNRPVVVLPEKTRIALIAGAQSG